MNGLIKLYFGDFKNCLNRPFMGDNEFNKSDTNPRKTPQKLYVHDFRLLYRQNYMYIKMARDTSCIILYDSYNKFQNF